MAQPFVGEIRMFAGNFAPAGWSFCDGQLMAVSQNDALFSLIGTTYGGDGRTTFGLPDLRGRLPVHQGNGFIVGEMGGTEEVTLTVNQLPSHTHRLSGTSDPAAARGLSSGMLARAPAEAYASRFTPSALSSQSLSKEGGSRPHNNVQPFLSVSFIISLFGIYPSRS